VLRDVTTLAGATLEDEAFADGAAVADFLATIAAWRPAESFLAGVAAAGWLAEMKANENTNAELNATRRIRHP
jgi:hypothetical protein